MPPSAASERARCPGKGSTVDSKFTVDPAGGAVGAGAADQTQNSAAASTNATSSEGWQPVSQDGPAEDAPQPLNKGEKYPRDPNSPSGRPYQATPRGSTGGSTASNTRSTNRIIWG